ncbi:MAG: LD-carboxypeptidase [Candidatus Binatia bacterium]
MRKPRPLQRGDLIGIVAPGAAVDAAAVETGARWLERAGFRVRIGAATLRQHGYLAGGDAERLADLASMFADDEVRAIIAARGGYGSGRLLPKLDARVAREHAKIVVGYSDVTFLLTYLVQTAGLVAFHGPMVADFEPNPAAAAGLLRLLTGDHTTWNAAAREIVQPGTAEGIIVGGCLSILVAGLGTPYAVQTSGRLLFIEDVNEKAYRIDRMLTQLRHAGKLDEVAGVVFGEMPGCSAPGDAVGVREVIHEAFADARYPVVFGLPAGHGGVVTLPVGVKARLAGERLSLLESPLAESAR